MHALSGAYNVCSLLMLSVDFAAHMPATKLKCDTVSVVAAQLVQKTRMIGSNFQGCRIRSHRRVENSAPGSPSDIPRGELDKASHGQRSTGTLAHPPGNHARTAQGEIGIHSKSARPPVARDASLSPSTVARHPLGRAWVGRTALARRRHREMILQEAPKSRKVLRIPTKKRQLYRFNTNLHGCLMFFFKINR